MSIYPNSESGRRGCSKKTTVLGTAFQRIRVGSLEADCEQKNWKASNFLLALHDYTAPVKSRADGRVKHCRIIVNEIVPTIPGNNLSREELLCRVSGQRSYGSSTCITTTKPNR